ncbi:GOLPH3/VPS74 family protein [Micromonospora rosaria]|uniref:GOLPH3/VPS74 family protein n=1 Tax=Micromonospora rosaria TaxID=47874 RepID=UPI002480DCD0|nr:GPP34 family phosphoprotein [Micromonospora rosaria]
MPRHAPPTTAPGCLQARGGDGHRFADEFHLLAHDDTGQPRLPRPVAAYGLAAALLAELHVSGRITFDQGQVQVRDRHRPADMVQGVLLDRIAAVKPESTRVWLAFVAESAHSQVAYRMCQTGLLTAYPARRWWRRGRPSGYRPVDRFDAAWPWVRLSQQLRDRAPLGDSDRILAGLVLHTHLDTALLAGASLRARVYLREVVEDVQPPVHELFAALAALVTTSVSPLGEPVPGTLR